MFAGVVNPCTGKLEWVKRDSDVTSETADISRELARSQYGDMLLDTERNVLYQRGLELAIADVKASGREPHVLDIGTGTGLLSMMAARAGATRVTACEVLRPMVKISRQVISANGYSDVIRVVPKRSTDMTELDMITRANILVTEVFDTELIGEGALVTIAHAQKHLLEPNSAVVPSSSRMYVRLIESDFLWQSHKLVPDELPRGIKVPSLWEECPGPPSVWDLHVDEIQVPDQMRLLSESMEIASFQFSDPDLSPDQSSPTLDIGVVEGGRCHGVVVWWDITLGDSVLTMDPWRYQWRDHWLQAVQLWNKPVVLNKGDTVKVGLQHDDYSIWFSFDGLCAESALSSSQERPLCVCGVHTACSRSRINMLNDRDRTSIYMQALSEALVEKDVIVCIGDGCLWPLFLLLQCPSAVTKHFYILSSSSHTNSVVKQLLEANGVSESVTFLDKLHSNLTESDFRGKQIDAVIGEPYFSSSLLPWHNLHFWYAVNSLQKYLTPSCCVLPGKAFLMAIAVNFDNLYKLRASIGEIEGFDITAFDEAVGKHVTTPEGIEAEPHPLWEYPSRPCSDVRNMMSFDFTSPLSNKAFFKESGEIVLNQENRPCHAVVFWMEYVLRVGITTSTGLSRKPSSSKKLEWNPSFKQAVYFLTPKDTSSASNLVKLDYCVEFSSALGSMDITISGSS